MAEVQKCSPCQFTTSPKDKEQSDYLFPELIVFYSVAVDYKGLIKADNYYTVALVCLYSEWAEVMHISSTSFQALQLKFFDYMTRHRKMKYIISDNGPLFSLHDLEKFCTRPIFQENLLLKFILVQMEMWKVLIEVWNNQSISSAWS